MYFDYNIDLFYLLGYLADERCENWPDESIPTLLWVLEIQEQSDGPQ